VSIAKHSVFVTSMEKHKDVQDGPMKNTMMKKILFLLIIYVSFSPNLWAATQTMSACTQAAFNTAYSAASSGDTIAFPTRVCSITWSGTTSIHKTNLTMQGSIIGRTILTGNTFTLRYKKSSNIGHIIIYLSFSLIVVLFFCSLYAIIIKFFSKRIKAG
jgi:hypothetical protein